MKQISPEINKVEWLEAKTPSGYLNPGKPEEVASQIPKGRWILICDTDAATVGAPCWHSAKYNGLNYQAIIDNYENNGGTVSVIYLVEDGSIQDTYYYGREL